MTMANTSWKQPGMPVSSQFLKRSFRILIPGLRDRRECRFDLGLLQMSVMPESGPVPHSSDAYYIHGMRKCLGGAEFELLTRNRN
jgi:hypothetical protein